MKTLSQRLIYARQYLSGVLGRRIRFAGSYTSWADAEASSTGYHFEAILSKTLIAARKVKEGKAVFERDGVAFKNTQYNFPLIWALTRAAVRYGRLHVLDFGGGLGSIYFQSRKLLHDCTKDLKWCVIEQSAHVEAGEKEFGSGELVFRESIEAACNEERYDVLILSGVLQYLPDPAGFLKSSLSKKFPSVILDRTPFMENGLARLTIQYVPKWIYPASYPAWFFSEKELLAHFSNNYDRIAEWSALDKHHPEGGRAQYKGFILELSTQNRSAQHGNGTLSR